MSLNLCFIPSKTQTIMPKFLTCDYSISVPDTSVVRWPVRAVRTSIFRTSKSRTSKLPTSKLLTSKLPTSNLHTSKLFSSKFHHFKVAEVRGFPGGSKARPLYVCTRGAGQRARHMPLGHYKLHSWFPSTARMPSSSRLRCSNISSDSLSRI